ncbi:diguanylate cyclase (GGDEF)-like protein [Sphaerotilus sulfidivorans]|uniref:diguanylate cyclase n=1 Tax=Sphaerotilus sulfidivorans TaxID=639200 RepID=A0A5C1PWA2_9BURK|nr:GGDEF domain-containing protein [Sphaerotilus sulfidivorans]NZD45006.1 GGDEF domain-containing protein [Sphaerotilus sulfidivorans]QEM99656.1 GGDEF domain-containing protein [Sphaerotilus sulfidivorans]
MELDVRTLMVAFSVNLFAGAIALPTIMGWRRIGVAARHAVLASGLQALGWFCLVMSTLARNEWPDRLLSTLAMGAMSASLVMLWRAIRLWTGHDQPGGRSLGLIVLWMLTGLMTLGYGLGFSDYAWWVGLANGVLGLQMLMVVGAALSPSPGTHRGWRAVIAASMLLMATLTFWRGLLGAFFTESYPFLTAPHPINQLSALASSVVLLLNSMALLMAYREEAERQLREQAITDGLTGLLNRRAWTERAEALLADARRYQQPLGLMMIDIDHFKRVNDDHGHARGDQALQLVARMLREQLRSGDLAGRYGGEEFCVLLTHTREGPALSLDQRLRQCLRLESEQALGFVLEYSAGLAALGENDRTLDDLLRRADDALYEAKRAGRAQVVLAAR